jgi:hypothetical protein
MVAPFRKGIDCLFVDIAGAMEITGLSRTSTRALLGHADQTVMAPSGHRKDMYLRCRVEEVKRQYECAKCKRKAEEGKQACYYCHNRFPMSEMTGSKICLSCQAKKTLKNFACHGDCCLHDIDCDRVRMLTRALAELQLEMEDKGKPKTTDNDSPLP